MFPDARCYSVTFDNKPFAAGLMKHAFRGILEGDGPKNRNAVVVKVSKYNELLYDIEANILAQNFATTFNTYMYALFPGSVRQITFRPLTKCTVSNVDLLQKYVKRGDLVTVEDIIGGYYEKFNNNVGYENPNRKELLLAFSHWTYISSKGRYMICDLQGVQHIHEFCLTDPVVHSLEEAYGKTDLGKDGMNAVLNGHTCNRYCQTLGLPVAHRILNALLPPKVVFFQRQLLNHYT